jgi:hypothetical protein
MGCLSSLRNAVRWNGDIFRNPLICLAIRPQPTHHFLARVELTDVSAGRVVGINRLLQVCSDHVDQLSRRFVRLLLSKVPAQPSAS